MGYLKGLLGAPEIADLVAYLGWVRASANPQGPVAYWPSRLDFGLLPDGGVAPQQIGQTQAPQWPRLNRGATPTMLAAFTVSGPQWAQFAVLG